MRKPNPLHILCAILIVCACLQPVGSFGQFPADSLKNWMTVLEEHDNSGNSLVDSLAKKLPTASEADKRSLRLALQQKKEESNPYFIVRRYLLLVYTIPLDSINATYRTALNTAYETGDEELIAYTCWQYGSHMTMWRETELAVMYCMNAADIYEEIGKPMSGRQYKDLADALYLIREYRNSINYSRKAISLLRSDFFLTTCANTTALAYQKLGIYDSALLYYDSANLFLKNVGNNEIYREIWKGILSGNKGQVYFLQGHYQKALPLFEFDFQQSKKNGEFDNAANTLQWAARTNLALGNTSTALRQIREAFFWMTKGPMLSNYRENLYYTAELIYRQAGITDSALYYSRKYQSLHDSIEARIANSRLEISRIKLENEKNYYNIKSFKQQRASEILTRNIIIASIFLLAIILLLFMNAQRLKTLHSRQILAERNRVAEMEIGVAKRELETFRQNLVEKTAIINQLQDQIDNTTLNNEQQLALSNLLQSTILTDDQWMNFKGLLEKIHPGFFYRLKEGYPDITMAEQRMAALSKLKMSARETAAMLGISLESVHKTRQRLKQRLSLSAEENLQEYIASL